MAEWRVVVVVVLVINKRSGSHVRRMSERLFGVLFGVLNRSVQPLNACPPVGPEALQACSLFQGTKVWLEPRLEPAENSSGAPFIRSAVLARTSIVLLATSSDTVRVAFRRYQAGEAGSKGVKGH